MNTPPHSRKICIFTGTRAEYGLLRPLIKELDRNGVVIQLVVSGTHLSGAHGDTWREIEADGHPISEKIEILMDADTETAVCTSMGLGMMRYGEALQRLQPDLVLILGDRYEAFAFAAAASVWRLPIAHLHGGEITTGAIDNALRHAITKLSHLHFTSTENSRRRVIQMGEDPQAVFNVGALGVENTKTIPRLAETEVRARLGIPEGRQFLLITFHPVTLDEEQPLSQLEALLSALAAFPDLICVFTGANADAGGRSINSRLAEASKMEPDRFRLFPSLGSSLFLSAASSASAVLGNSSSGVIEAPSLGVPVIDIGTRQNGRERSEGVLWSACDPGEIEAAISKALSPEHVAVSRRAANPYDGGETAQKVARILSSVPLNDLVRKQFFTV